MKIKFLSSKFFVKITNEKKPDLMITNLAKTSS